MSTAVMSTPMFDCSSEHIFKVRFFFHLSHDRFVFRLFHVLVIFPFFERSMLSKHRAKQYDTTIYHIQHRLTLYLLWILQKILSIVSIVDSELIGYV